MNTSSDKTSTDETRMARIKELQPEMSSFDAGSFNRMPGGVFMNSPRFLAKLARVDLDGNVKPEIQVFDFGMIHIALEAFRQSFNKIQGA